MGPNRVVDRECFLGFASHIGRLFLHMRRERPLIRILTAGFTIERTHYLYQDFGRVFLIASSYLLMKTNVNYRNFVEPYLTYTER